MRINDCEVKSLENQPGDPADRAGKRQIFIIGSKGIPAAYGGFETFVEKLTANQKSADIRYHVARMASDDLRYEYNGVECFDVKIPEIGPAKAVYYDLKALKRCIDYCKAWPAIRNPIFYVLACRIGPFIGSYKKIIEKLGGKLYVNPDGHEWMRSKWCFPVRCYWKYSEKLMIKHADLLICDSENIERYIRNTYAGYKPKTTFIAYGADVARSAMPDDAPAYRSWLAQNHLTPKGYYLVVGRFVPENNFETMIREFMRSKTTRSFALITNVSSAFLNQLKKNTGFDKDPRIKFVGTVYDQDLLKKIRENAYAYFHGHSVGGTNPSLLEALASTDLNLLLDVGFNREVALDSALYWNKDPGNLATVIDNAEKLSAEQIEKLAQASSARIADAYSWDKIVDEYERLWKK